VAENPVVTIARLLGGITLLHGRLGHQVLGQLLIANTNEVAIAGAAVVIAGTAGQENAAAQVAIRTALPALAVRSLLVKKDERLQRREKLVGEREAVVAATLRKRDEKIAAQAKQIERHRGWIAERDRLAADRDRVAEERDRIAGEQNETMAATMKLQAKVRALEATWKVAASTNAELGDENRKLNAVITDLRKERLRLAGLDVDEVPRKATAKTRGKTPAKSTKRKRATRPKKPGKPKD
jgi:hypothetical protein